MRCPKCVFGTCEQTFYGPPRGRSNYSCMSCGHKFSLAATTNGAPTVPVTKSLSAIIELAHMRHKKVLAMLSSGMTPKAVAIETGYTRNFVYKIASDNGVQVKAISKELKARRENTDEIKRRILAGERQCDIAADLNLPRATVKSIAKRHKLQREDLYRIRFMAEMMEKKVA